MWKYHFDEKLMEIHLNQWQGDYTIIDAFSKIVTQKYFRHFTARVILSDALIDVPINLVIPFGMANDK